MRKATLYASYGQGNRLFRPPPAEYNDRRTFLTDLQSEFKSVGFELSTQDINPPENSEIVIYIDMPRIRLDEADQDKSYLMIMEPPVVKAEAWNQDNWKFFNRIFTYDGSLINNVNCFKYNYCYTMPDSFPPSEARDRFCVTVIGHKSSNHHLELYSKRLDVIEWFEKHHPDKLDFFGTGWEDGRPLAPGWQGKLLRRRRRLSSCQGPVNSKFHTLCHYKFALCFENCGGVNGYVSEKIFDAFFASTIPIYLGAPDIKQLIPPDSFIDFREFDSMDALLKFLLGLDELARQRYVQSAQNFINSIASDPFRSSKVVKSIVDTIMRARVS